MSDIKVSCSNCGQHILVDSMAVGRQVICPSCSTPFMIASTPAALSPDPLRPPLHKGPLALWLTVAGVVCAIAVAVGFWSYSGGKSRQAKPNVSVPRTGKLDVPVASNVSTGLVVLPAAPDHSRVAATADEEKRAQKREPAPHAPSDGVQIGPSAPLPQSRTEPRTTSLDTSPPTRPAVGMSGEKSPAEDSQRRTDTKLSKRLNKWGMAFAPPPGWTNRSADTLDAAVNSLKAEMFGDIRPVLHADLWAAPNDAAKLVVGVFEADPSTSLSALLDAERAETKAAQRSGVVRKINMVVTNYLGGLDCVLSDVVRTNGSRRVSYSLLHQNHIICLLWLVRDSGQSEKYRDALSGVLRSFAFGHPMGEVTLNQELRWALIVLDSGIYPLNERNSFFAKGRRVLTTDSGGIVTDVTSGKRVSFTDGKRQFFTAAGLGHDPGNPVRIQTIVNLVGDPDALHHNVAASDFQLLFDQYEYGLLVILVDPHNGTVCSVSAPTAWWTQGLSNKAATELSGASLWAPLPSVDSGQ